MFGERGEGRGGGVEGGSDRGSWGKEREGGLSGAFLAYFRSIRAATMLQDSPSCLCATWQWQKSKATTGRRRKRRAALPVGPAALVAGTPFASGGDVGAV